MLVSFQRVMTSARVIHRWFPLLDVFPNWKSSMKESKVHIRHFPVRYEFQGTPHFPPRYLPLFRPTFHRFWFLCCHQFFPDFPHPEVWSHLLKLSLFLCSFPSPCLRDVTQDAGIDSISINRVLFLIVMPRSRRSS